MSTNRQYRFRPTLEGLETREVLSGNLGAALIAPSFTGAAPGQQSQAANQMAVDYNSAFTNAGNNLAAQKVTVVNGVADITEAARATLESDILARLPRSLGSYPLVGEVSLDRVTLNRLTLDSNGNFNGQLRVTFKYQMFGTKYANIDANLQNNQLSLASDNALVRQFGKLDQRQQEWQPRVTAALDELRSRLMPQYFGSQAGSANHRR